MGGHTLTFSWFTALAIFVGYFAIDWLTAYYTVAVMKRRAFLSAHAGAAIYFLTAYGVVNYTQNWWYVIFVVLGSWAGTYTYVRRRSK